MACEESMAVLLFMILGAIGYAMSPWKQHVVRKNGQRSAGLPEFSKTNYRTRVERRGIGAGNVHVRFPWKSSVRGTSHHRRFLGGREYRFWRPRNELRGPSADRGDGGADTFSGQPYHTRSGDAAHTVWQRRAGCRTRGGEWRQEYGGGWPVGRVGGGLRKTMITAAEPIARRTFRRTSSLRGPNENSGHLRERFIYCPVFPWPLLLLKRPGMLLSEICHNPFRNAGF